MMQLMKNITGEFDGWNVVTDGDEPIAAFAEESDALLFVAAKRPKE